MVWCYTRRGAILWELRCSLKVLLTLHWHSEFLNAHLLWCVFVLKRGIIFAANQGSSNLCDNAMAPCKNKIWIYNDMIRQWWEFCNTHNWLENVQYSTAAITRAPVEGKYPLAFVVFYPNTEENCSSEQHWTEEIFSMRKQLHSEICLQSGYSLLKRTTSCQCVLHVQSTMSMHVWLL